MLLTELLEIIGNGENSGVAFKRDNIRPEQLAKEVVAFANVRGGRIFLGVEDEGNISGIQRGNIQEWVMNVFRDKIHPQMIPFYEEINTGDGRKVAVVSIASGLSKPYAVRHNNREDVYIRMGDRSEIASREQQLRLFESGVLHVETLPVPGAAFEQLDLDRIHFYLKHIIEDPGLPVTEEEWVQRLYGMGLMAEDGLGNKVCSVAGLICFGSSPRRYLKQAGIRVMSFQGKDKEYRAQLDTILDSPLTARWKITKGGSRELLDNGLIEKISEMLKPFISEEDPDIDGHMRREKNWFYPWPAVRGIIVNALIHRDWTRSVDIEICNYADRLEVVSPGKLHNSMTVEKMLAGQRSPRNPSIVEILRDFNYVDARGMGIRTKVIPLMKSHNGVEPVFEATDDYLKVVLPRAGIGD